MAGMTIELSEYVIDAIAEAVVKKMQEPKTECDNCDYKEWLKGEFGDAISRRSVLDSIEKYKRIQNCVSDFDKVYNLGIEAAVQEIGNSAHSVIPEEPPTEFA